MLNYFDSVERHSECCKYANTETFNMFSVRGPYEVGTEMHEFWLQAFDSKMKVMMING